MPIVPLLAVLLACWGERAYIVEGTVVEVTRPGEVVLDHKEIPGLMGAMVMPFDVADPALTQGLVPGHRVVARFEILESGGVLTKLRVTGKGPPPEKVDDGPAPVRPGEVLPALDVPTADGSVIRVGEGQDERLAVAFLYTRCPIPEFCPAVVSRLQALQPRLGEGQRILTITLDPEHDTPDVLKAFAEQVGADPARWRFGRLDPEALSELALRSALPVVRDGAEIVHGLRLLVLDRGGRLVERYDDNGWPLDRVVEQLATGGPPAPAGAHGTISAPPAAESND